MSYRICKDGKPQEWDGTHYLTCIHISSWDLVLPYCIFTFTAVSFKF